MEANLGVGLVRRVASAPLSALALAAADFGNPQAGDSVRTSENLPAKGSFERNFENPRKATSKGILDLRSRNKASVRRSESLLKADSARSFASQLKAGSERILSLQGRKVDFVRGSVSR